MLETLLLLNHHYNDESSFYTNKQIPSTIKSTANSFIQSLPPLGKSPLSEFMSDESLQLFVFWERASIFEVLVTQIDVFLPLWCSFLALGQLKQRRHGQGAFFSTMVLPKIWPRPYTRSPVGGFYLNDTDCPMYNSWYKNLKLFW